MRFAITFHGGFRVATGYARTGVDATVDRDEPLPGSALKGLMRASATLLLPAVGEVEHPLVSAVFGTTGEPSPWNWGPAQPATPLVVQTRGRLRIDARNGVAARDMLRFDDEVWLGGAEFDLIQTMWVADPDPQRLLLAVSAQGVHSIGSDRRRGLGWVSIRSTDTPVDDSTIAALLELRAHHGGKAPQ